MLNTAERKTNARNIPSDWKAWKPQRGEIYLVDLGEGLNCEQSGLRPAVIVSNNIGNSMGSIVVVAPLTTTSKNLPVHVKVGRECGLLKDSYILTEHLRSVSKKRFFSKGSNPFLVGKLTPAKEQDLQRAIRIELALT